jgi:hypothetical protein
MLLLHALEFLDLLTGHAAIIVEPALTPPGNGQRERLDREDDAMVAV